MLPESLKAPLQNHLKQVKAVHESDLADGWGRVLLPDALDRKYPNAPKEWRWRVTPQRWRGPAGPRGPSSRALGSLGGLCIQAMALAMVSKAVTDSGGRFNAL